MANGSHTFRVYATYGGIADSSPATSTWTIDSAAPSLPTSLQATRPLATSVGLSWVASTDNVAVTGYNIFRDGSAYATIGATTSWTDGAVNAAATPAYALQAFDAAGNTSAVTGTITAPAPPPPLNSALTRAPYLTDLVGLHVAINFATDQSSTTGSIRYGTVGTDGSCSGGNSHCGDPDDHPRRRGL